MLVYLALLENEEDKTLFIKIYEENYLKMYHIAFRILNQKMDAENAVQEAFLSVINNFSKYSKLSCSEMTGLCVSIVKHKAIDVLRKQQHLSVQELENVVLYNENQEFEPVAHMESEDKSAYVKRIMSKMPETLMVVLDLKYFYDYSN